MKSINKKAISQHQNRALKRKKYLIKIFGDKVIHNQSIILRDSEYNMHIEKADKLCFEEIKRLMLDF